MLQQSLSSCGENYLEQEMTSVTPAIRGNNGDKVEVVEKNGKISFHSKHQR